MREATAITGKRTKFADNTIELEESKLPSSFNKHKSTFMPSSHERMKIDFTNDVESKLEVHRQMSLGTAAELAANRRSINTGQIRKLSTIFKPESGKHIDPDQLSSIFGGSVKPKLATEKVNIPKEKEKALEWISLE